MIPRTIAMAPILFGLHMMAIGMEPILPPPEMNLKEEWATLEKKNYSNWEIGEFIRWGAGADGGSIAFDFRTTAGIRFNVLVANPSYSTEEERQRKHQVIYLIESGRFYLLEPNSKQEKDLLEMLHKVKQGLKEDGDTSEAIIDALINTIGNRKAVGNGWPE